MLNAALASFRMIPGATNTFHLMIAQHDCIESRTALDSVYSLTQRGECVSLMALSGCSKKMPHNQALCFWATLWADSFVFGRK